MTGIPASRSGSIVATGTTTANVVMTESCTGPATGVVTVCTVVGRRWMSDGFTRCNRTIVTGKTRAFHRTVVHSTGR